MNKLSFIPRKIVFLLFVGVFLLSSFSSLKGYITLFWDEYNIEITVPDDFEVLNETETEFEAKNDDIQLNIHFWKESISLEQMDEKTLQNANEMNLEGVDYSHPFSNKDFQGYYVEGFKNNNRVVYAGIIDNQSDLNFFVTIQFDDDNIKAEKRALKILNSIDRK